MTEQKLPPHSQAKSAHARGFSAIHDAAFASVPASQLAKLAENLATLEPKVRAHLCSKNAQPSRIVALQAHVHELAPFEPEFEQSLDGHDVTAGARLALSAQTLLLANALDKYQYSLAASNQERWNSLSRAIVSIHQEGLWPLSAPSDDGS